MPNANVGKALFMLRKEGSVKNNQLEEAGWKMR